MTDPILDFNFEPGDTATLHYITQDGEDKSSIVHVEDIVSFKGDKMYVINIPERTAGETENEIPASLHKSEYERPNYIVGLAEPDELEWPIRTINVIGGKNA